MDNLVSVIIPTFNEQDTIQRCIRSVYLSEYDSNLIEVIVVDGLSSDSTLDKVRELTKDYPTIRVLSNPEVITPCAFNIGIKNSNGKFVLILSAHSTITKDYIGCLVHEAQKEKSDLIGGVFEVGLRNDTAVARSIRRILSNKFATGNSASRAGVSKTVKADTASGLYRKSVFGKVGFFDERLLRCQDLEMSARMRNSDLTIHVTDKTKYTYLPRSTLKSFCKQGFKTGYWIGYVAINFWKPVVVRSRHMVPAAHLLMLILSITAAMYLHPAPLVVYLLTYLGFLLTTNNGVTPTERLTDVAITAAYHAFYGLGTLVGIAKNLWR